MKSLTDIPSQRTLSNRFFGGKKSVLSKKIEFPFLEKNIFMEMRKKNFLFGTCDLGISFFGQASLRWWKSGSRLDERVY